MSPRLKLTGLLMLAVSTSVGCSTTGLTRKETISAQDFYSQPMADRLKSYRRNSLEVQLTLFFFGNQIRHPPALYLADCFALSGDAGAELIQKRLQQDTADLNVRDMATLIRAMNEIGSSSLASNPKLIDQLRLRALSIRDSGWREYTLKIVSDIETTPSGIRLPSDQCGE
ncbi:hypothetical protein [Pseudomarimonas arenosa]|uniref:Lipoprotein n=1 Tax=Pseudomarimonas arenosa TaxID=2774145 RepID=A0AAW3ZRW4_9GAMM|nr:hypothetical protein [Pseudomarimonas arenosa]MBD8528275.1 hypothetical protein [Pseudomarimonas arenosa]